jgi:hypothetical protein
MLTQCLRLSRIADRAQVQAGSRPLSGGARQRARFSSPGPGRPRARFPAKLSAQIRAEVGNGNQRDLSGPETGRGDLKEDVTAAAESRPAPTRTDDAERGRFTIDDDPMVPPAGVCAQLSFGVSRVPPVGSGPARPGQRRSGHLRQVGDDGDFDKPPGCSRPVGADRHTAGIFSLVNERQPISPIFSRRSLGKADTAGTAVPRPFRRQPIKRQSSAAIPLARIQIRIAGPIRTTRGWPRAIGCRTPGEKTGGRAVRPVTHILSVTAIPSPCAAQLAQVTRRKLRAGMAARVGAAALVAGDGP